MSKTPKSTQRLPTPPNATLQQQQQAFTRTRLRNSYLPWERTENNRGVSVDETVSRTNITTRRQLLTPRARPRPGGMSPPGTEYTHGPPRVRCSGTRRFPCHTRSSSVPRRSFGSHCARRRCPHTINCCGSPSTCRKTNRPTRKCLGKERRRRCRRPKRRRRPLVPTRTHTSHRHGTPRAGWPCTK